jgi:hypothetical protein
MPAGTLRTMNSKHAIPRSRSPWFLRPAATGMLCVTAGLSFLAFAGTNQPDPPVPIERMASIAAAEPDCRCAVLHARDMESRVEGHVERWEAMSLARTATLQPPTRTAAARVHMTSLVEGIVGFPVRQYRLAADADSVDDGAGSD